MTETTPDPFRDHFRRFARYNAWANGRLLDAVAALPAEAAWAPRKAFFGSIFGTLNHILVGDRVWLDRMTGCDLGWFTGLDQVLYRDFDAFRTARETQDAALLEAVETLPLTGVFVYRDSKGRPQERDWGVVLAHLFNHQTHHRGQVHDMLSQCGVTPPPLDLIYFPGAQTPPST